MKEPISKIGFIALLMAILVAGCKKEKLVSETFVGNIESVFELKYGDSRKLTYAGKKIEITIKNIEDKVSINCALADFGNNQEALSNIRLYAYLQINNQDKILKVSSKPCGALPYENHGHDIKDVEDLINDLESAPANSKDSSYFTDAFINLFGEGSTIENTPLRIFMAKAFPTKYGQPNANIEDYSFIFIVTTQK